MKPHESVQRDGKIAILSESRRGKRLGKKPEMAFFSFSFFLWNHY
jgi:hypothetical protein